METQEIIHRWEKNDPTKKVKLMKMSKSYQWEITYENTDNKELLLQITSLNDELQKQFGTTE